MIFNMSYYCDFQTRPIGKPNPYHCCEYCGRSVPEINGRLDRHLKNCKYRIDMENKGFKDE